VSKTKEIGKYFKETEKKRNYKHLTINNLIKTSLQKLKNI
jgi:hypothetical protein